MTQKGPSNPKPDWCSHPLLLDPRCPNGAGLLSRERFREALCFSLALLPPGAGELSAGTGKGQLSAMLGATIMI